MALLAVNVKVNDNKGFEYTYSDFHSSGFTDYTYTNKDTWVYVSVSWIYFTMII